MARAVTPTITSQLVEFRAAKTPTARLRPLTSILGGLEMCPEKCAPGYRAEAAAGRGMSLTSGLVVLFFSWFVGRKDLPRATFRSDVSFNDHRLNVIEVARRWAR